MRGFMRGGQLPSQKFNLRNPYNAITIFLSRLRARAHTHVSDRAGFDSLRIPTSECAKNHLARHLAGWLRYRRICSGMPEDTNHDDVVDDADLLQVLFDFGEGC